MTTVLALLFLASPQQPDRPAPRLDCRYTRPAVAPAETTPRTVFLPDDDVFAPPMADPRELRMSLGLARQDSFIEGLISAGGHFGLLGRRRDGMCDGFQIGIFGGAASQFDQDAAERDLINTDFMVGLQVTARRGRGSARLRVYHQSSHFGDEFLLKNPQTVAGQFGIEAIDALLSIDWAMGRVYAGGGYLDFAFGDPDSPQAQAGIELRKRMDDGGARPVAGVDVTAFGAREWGTTRSAVAGLEWTSPAAIRRMRALVVFVDGFTPYGQSLMRTKMRRLGLQAQFDF